MAGLGDLVLAFAGGAAGVVNDEAKAARDSDLRMKERMEELKASQKIKMAETRYTSAHNQWEKENERLRAFKAMGGNTTQGRVNRARKNGQTDEEIERKLAAGLLEASEVPTPGKAPLFTGADLESFKSRPADRKATKKLSKLFNLSERNDKFKKNSDLVRRASGDPAFVDTTDDDITVSGDAPAPDISQKEYAKFLKEKKAPDFFKPEKIMVDDKEAFGAFDKTTGRWFVNGESIDSTRISPVQDPEERKDELLRLQDERDTLKADISAGKSVKENEQKLAEVNARITKNISIVAQDRVIGLTPDKRGLNELENQMTALDLGKQSIQNVQKLASTGVSGAPGVLLDFKGAVKDTVLGFMENFGLSDRVSVAEQSAQVAFRTAQLEAAGITEQEILDLTDLDYLRGRSKSARIDAFYAVANGLKDANRKDISKFDVENTKRLLASSSGGEGAAGALDNALEMIERRQVAVLKQAFLKEGLSAKKKLQFGRQLIRITTPNRLDKQGRPIWGVWPHPETDEKTLFIMTGLDRNGNPTYDPYEDVLTQ